MQWENDHERHFVVHDNRYLDNIEKQWEDKNLEKEQEKMKRVRGTCRDLVLILS